MPGGGDEDFGEQVARGIAAAHAMDFALAERCYQAALALRPDNAPVQAALGLLRLAQGRYAEGWPLYEARTRFDGNLIRASGIAEWRGEDLAGRSLLVWPEQGLGDEIQMARFVPHLRSLGAQVVLACSPPLARLFAQMQAPVVPLAQGAVVPRTDFYVRNLSLPHRLGVTLQSLSPQPYLSAPSAPRRGGVGVVWRGNPEHPNDAERSLPSIEVLEPLRAAAELVDLQAPQGDFLDTAARIQALDQVICVDTAMAHLAGALGVPCWVMLPAYRTDWRWMTGREDSPWYGSLRLYRQSARGDWAGVVQRMLADLRSGSAPD